MIYSIFQTAQPVFDIYFYLHSYYRSYIAVYADWQIFWFRPAAASLLSGLIYYSRRLFVCGTIC